MFINNKFRPMAEWENKDGGNSRTPTLDNVLGGTGTGGGESHTPTLDKVFGDKDSGSGSSGGAAKSPEATTDGYIAWADTDAGKAAYDAYASASNAVNAYGTKFNFANQNELDEIMRQIQANPEFTYDLDGDALYQQYKDQYIRNGQLAMEDTIGQAAALTGGYGNSYAQTAGQQAYYAQLDKLNNVIPELYQLAYDKHQDERDELYRQYSMLAGEKDDAYNKWVDERDRLVDAEDRARSEYDYGRSEYMDDMLTEIELQPKEEEFKSYINNMSAEDFKDHLDSYAGDPDALNEFLKMCVNQGMISPEQSLFYYTMMVEGKDVEVK